MTYQWKTGAVVKASAEDAGAQCEALYSAGKLTPRNLVDVNRPEDAPLHNAFEWRDNVAAEKWRESQAQYIIRNLACIAVERPGDSPTRAFVRVTNERKHYTPYTVAIHNMDMRAILLDGARRDMEAFTQKYRSLCEVSTVVLVMDETLASARTGNNPFPDRPNESGAAV